MNTFFQSQFNRCSFVRTLHSHKINNKIPGHIKYASVLLTRTFEKHFEMNNSVLTYLKNLKNLTIELCKLFDGIYSDIMKNVLSLNTFSNYNIRKR